VVLDSIFGELITPGKLGLFKKEMKITELKSPFRYQGSVATPVTKLYSKPCFYLQADFEKKFL
jgi:hypothetical protein